MSKNLEKKTENKELEKKLEIKEFKEKPEKREFKEFKEKPEKREHKEIKEKPERKEFKEPIKEKVEVKEIEKIKPEKENFEKAVQKELEKPVAEKGDKELVETFDPGGEITQPRTAAEAFAADVSAAKPKETDKAPVKDIEKIKPEKEQLEKAVQKEIEKIKPEKELKIEKHELKDHKIEKFEHKEHKFEKHEIKDFKVEIFEKASQKELIPEKPLLENDPKGIVENPQFPGGEVDPAKRAPLFPGSGTADERLAKLEEVVTKLTHFIGVDLRPDLSAGALKNEADVNATKQGTEAGDDKKQKK